MELELYAPIPEGYEFVALRAVKAGDEVISATDGKIYKASGNGLRSEVRMIVRKIKPLIKRSFRVDVLDEEPRNLDTGETGIDFANDTFTNAEHFKTFSKYTPCIVTELPVENE